MTCLHLNTAYTTGAVGQYRSIFGCVLEQLIEHDPAVSEEGRVERDGSFKATHITLVTIPTVEDDGRAGAVVDGGIGGRGVGRGRYDVVVIAQLLVPLQRRHLDTTLTPIQRIIC